MIRRTSLRVSLIAVLATSALALAAADRLIPTASAQQPAAPAQPSASVPAGSTQDRITRLEQRILELQSVIATLQTFVQQGGSVQSPGAGGSNGISGGAGGGPSELSIRVTALETQIRALTGQMEQLNRGFNGAGAPSGGAVPQPGAGRLQPGPDFGAAPAPQQGAAPYGTTLPPATQQAAPAPQQQQRLPWQPDQNSLTPSPIPSSPQTAGLPPQQGQQGAGARGAYDISYQSFLRNDLQSAERGFRSFVETYPNDQLTSHAYYWLGRTHFAKQQFEPAAKAFLAGYKINKQGAVAPDSLLHLGKSLSALGEKEAACSTLKAVSKQFPNAPGQLQQDVSAEMSRNGC